MIPTSDQHEHFREQGYIVLKDVLSDELVSSLSELCKLSEEYHEKYSSQYFVDRNEENFFIKYKTALDIANENDSGDKHYTIIEIVANADSVNALLWSSAASSFICIVLFAIQSIMDLDSMVDAWTTGFKDMMSPILILLLAWALGSVINDLHTSVYLSSMLQGNLPPEWLVPLATILAA